jgi:DNA polymerase III epsilon subunit-like protein
MSLISFDGEMDGPYPADYSMISFGAVIVEPTLKKTFYGEMKPISHLWKPDALAVSGFSREQCLKFDEPVNVLHNFAIWIEENSVGRPVFIGDNPGFDFAFLNYYFHKFYGSNPFGYSSRRIGDMYCGLVKDGYARWKHLRKTKHTHNALVDAIGNAEVILHMEKEMGFKIGLK